MLGDCWLSLSIEIDNLYLDTELQPNIGQHFRQYFQRLLRRKPIDQTERVLPDLRDHILFVADREEKDSPAYPLHRLGPMYGWANRVEQAGPRRLPILATFRNRQFPGYIYGHSKFIQSWNLSG